MLVMNKEDANLREYLQQNHNQLIWKDRIKIAYDIIVGILRIHYENAIHRDLHSGNILFSQEHPRFDIGDLGFCGPANKPSNSIYGNLPYIAPEVIIGKQTTFKSDIYSIGMLMWEISSGEPPFIKYEHDNDLVMNIIKGMRPRIIPGTPPEYISLMKQCWDADPLKRPDIRSLWNKIREVIRLYQNMPNESEANNNLNKTSDLEANYTSKTFTSKVHQFENLPEPRNATEEEQEAFYSKSCDLHISDNINSKKLSKLFKKLRIKHDPKK
ncbi:kinase-like domain-containing protein [Glomus cerebriforme]|uniref:Kinase-like domain-containing protein n=1 Tax=Glomus cerebriforme TaxID=658196 RepID=A0A397SZS3_9GLOM|nr:kinase-like domain-containing protein [Glomus cerebriforme]